MRVIAGRYGGRRLQAPAGQDTRPTPSRAREALFSSLGDLDGLRVLDAFAGSGALGIEALSRGAATCVFCETGRAALDALRGNLRALDLGPPAAVAVRGEWKTAVARARTAGEAFDLCLVDAPFDDLPAQIDDLIEALPPVLAPSARVVIEGPSRRPAPVLEAWPVARRRDRTYGSVRISIVELDLRERTPT